MSFKDNRFHIIITGATSNFRGRLVNLLVLFKNVIRGF